MKNVEDLIVGGLLRFAALPPDNPQRLDFLRYTIPLIEHDYPAKTAAMWNAAYRKFELPAGNVMLVGDPKRLEEIFGVFRRDEKYLGGGAGVGFKDESVQFLDELEPGAEAIGAVNFIMKTDEGKLKGYNTDGLGFALSLEERFSRRNERLAGKKIVIIGAGGAGNAVAFALAGQKCRLIILNRTVTKAEDLAEAINRHYGLKNEAQARSGGEDRLAAEVVDADAVVNVSSKGSSGLLEPYSALAPVELPATEENIRANRQAAAGVLSLLRERTIVCDIVLTKGVTATIEQALEAGFEVLNGVPMVVNQGVETFWLLHGKELEQRGITKDEVRIIMRQAALG